MTEMRSEIVQRGPSSGAPFVEVAEQQRRSARTFLDRLENGTHLPSANLPEQAEMRCHDSQRTGRQRQVDQQRAARLRAGQRQAAHGLHLSALQEQRIAMPAMSVRS